MFPRLVVLDLRQMVELAWFHQLAHREVAERLGIAEAHSRVLLSRAL
jgi:DNA-directed RNA polymerase specialized sigma24 family protein